VATVRFPVGLFFVRGDRAGDGGTVASQVRASLTFWDLDSANSIDFIVAGWKRGHDGKAAFDVNDFHSYVKEIESLRRWRYSGESDLLLLNFEFYVSHVDLIPTRIPTGGFLFREVMVLPIEDLLRTERIGSIDGLVAELTRICAGRNTSTEGSPIWDVSDRIGYLRGKRSVWDAVKKTFLKDFATVYDELKPYVVCDLSRPAIPPLLREMMRPKLI
jgi:hypothetical protein